MNVEEVITRLRTYGYESTDEAVDSGTITLLIGDAEQYIKHYCNVCQVPACLDHVILDMVCGKFLQFKKSTGQLTGIQLDGVLKSVRDGDTTVEYNVSYMADPDSTFLTFVDKLINGHTNELIAHRRMRW